MADQFANNAISILTGGAGGVGSVMNTTDAQWTVRTGDGAKFPNLGNYRLSFGFTNPEIVNVTSKSVDTFFGTRGAGLAAPDTNPSQVWGPGTPIQFAVTAGVFQDLWNAIGQTYSVANFGATGNGVTDDTAAIQAAINAAISAGGGIAFLPAGTYVLSASLNLSASYVQLQGSGWNTTLKPVSGATFDVIKTGNIPYGGANSLNDLQGIVVSDLTIDGANMTANVAGQGNGIHFWGARQSFIRRVLFKNMKNYCAVLEGATANHGYNCTVEYCEMDSTCNGGVLTCNGCEADWILYNEIIGCAQTLVAGQPAFGSQSTQGHLIDNEAGLSVIFGNVFGGGASGGTMNSAVLLNNENIKVLGNRFDLVQNIGIDIFGSGGNFNHVIANNEFKDCGLIVAGPCIRVDASQVVIEGNVFGPDGSIHYTYCIAESSHALNNRYVHNSFRTVGTAGFISLNAGSTTACLDNINFNPRGPLVSPTMPLSGSSFTNSFGVNATVYVTGGSVSVMAVNGTSMGIALGTFRVPAGSYITPTYSQSPSWTWFGE